MGSVAESKRREGPQGGIGIQRARRPKPGFFEGFQKGHRVRVDQVYKCRDLGPQVNSRNYPALPNSWKQTALIKPKQILSSQMKTT